MADALGVPFEKKLSNYQPLIDWDGKTFLGSVYHNLLPGQYSDDGQLSIIVAESLIQNSGFDPGDLANRYMDWFFSGAARGFGTTTMLAMKNLDAGVHWSVSGIAGSLGNGTAMRAAPFGVYFRDKIPQLVEACAVDSAITHASPDAEAGSIAIALAAAYAVNNDLDNLLEKILPHLPDSRVKSIIFSLDSLISTDLISPVQALQVLGTKANVQETVPAALYCFLKFDNYHQAVIAAIKAGGDTDTTAAIVGALFGAKDGIQGMDPNIIANVEDSAKLVELDNQLYNRANTYFFPRN